MVTENTVKTEPTIYSGGSPVCGGGACDFAPMGPSQFLEEYFVVTTWKGVPSLVRQVR